jgi:NADP-dependent 3-hydroxy acid dehydrogenase YdfG
MQNLSDKFIAIVGGSKGLGLVCTKTLLQEGSTVFVLSRSTGGLNKLFDEFPQQLHWLQTDIADQISVASAFAKMRQINKQLNHLIIAAGATTPRHFEAIKVEDVMQNVLINFAGPIYCLQQAALMMQGGRAIYISSESADVPFPMLSLYAATKGAMETVIKGIRQELYRDRNIQLTVLRAGSMEGTSFGENWSNDTIQEFIATAAAQGHLKMSGTQMPPQRVADAISFLFKMGVEAGIQMLDVRCADAY